MIPTIHIGQYIPADTPVHSLDPRVKFLLTMLLMALLCVGTHGFLFITATVWIIFAAHIAAIPLMTLLKALKPVAIIVIFAMVINIFFIEGKTVLWHWRSVHITVEGLTFAGLMSARILLLVAGSSLMTFTTTPMELVDGLEKLLQPLKRLSFPVGQLAMVITITVRFIPILQSEVQKIMLAQNARGACFNSGSLLKRTKALMSVVIPIFIGALQRAEELALAIEARCYRPGASRTRMHPIQFRAKDWVVLTVTAVVFSSLGIIDWRMGFLQGCS